MCLQLYLASPLTLSEIRAMLPEGVVGDLVPSALHREWVERFPRARSVLTLRQGGCACGLTGHRNSDMREEERRLRARYREAGAGRDRVIMALDRHRKSPRGGTTAGTGTLVLAAFVAEHARNAGAALYFLDFSTESARMPPWPDATPNAVNAAQVRAHPGTWLPEQTPVLVQA